LYLSFFVLRSLTRRRPSLSLLDALPIWRESPLQQQERPIRGNREQPERQRAGDELAHVGLRDAAADERAEPARADVRGDGRHAEDRKSTRLNSSHRTISYAVFCL